ncbi:hypothetical protein [Mucilaginibacter pedocola]|uniref:Uncharacterized protein n=1 Tax=Mucilaginibacter pedocola TaxID=1792845 RepID=A0A1S9PBF5_9SPHI|nr:hypothetical protein [Mucilaginibacter pedocola]OOQ58285.1 hypothetical protein BC343_11670 [Mucilaginibacter pedocola]
MATNNVLGKVYETLLCSPGMNEVVKIDVKVNRKAILLLSSVIESGINKQSGNLEELLELVPEADVQELKAFAEDCLRKAGLTELSEKVRSLQVKA